MNRILRHIFWGLLFCIAFTAMYVVYYNARKEEVLQKAHLGVLLAASQTSPEIPAPVKFSDCHINGPLPDAACTPGDIFANTPLATMCTSGYTKTVRNVSVATKKKVYAMYGIAYPQPTGSYELDHLIPLALGGNNDVANLFPEAANPYPGFKEKDVVEIYLYLQVCAGRIDRAAAQAEIAKDWLSIYNNLSPETIQTIKAKYRSWAN